MKIRCRTRFDVTATGVLGQYKENRETHNRANGVFIRDRTTWNKARNQQRNWETLNQIIALRCLPENITLPRRDGDAWYFDFEIDNTAALSDQPNDLVFLINDAEGVPMITGLEESTTCDPVIHTLGSAVNTEFWALDDKYIIGE